MSTPAEPPVTATTSAALRPWPQFLDLSALSLPISLSESSYRVTQNLRYFLPNYVVLTLIIFLLTLLTRPLSLILFLGISAAWVYLVLARDEPLTVLDYDIDQRFVVGFLAIITFGALFWTHSLAAKPPPLYLVPNYNCRRHITTIAAVVVVGAM